MKKTVKWIRLTSALLSATCLTMVTAPTVSAVDSELIWHWGTTASDTFTGMEQLDTGDMFSWLWNSDAMPQTYVYSYTSAQNGTQYQRVYSVMPDMRTLRFTLRAGIMEDEALPQIFEILKPFYPGLADGYLPEYHMAAYPAGTGGTKNCEYTLGVGISEEGIQCSLEDLREGLPAQDVSDSIMKALAAKGLITEYYGWGQTAKYQDVSEGTEWLTYQGKNMVEVPEQTVAFQEEPAAFEDFTAWLADKNLYSAEKLREELASLEEFNDHINYTDSDLHYTRYYGVTAKGRTVQFFKVAKADGTAEYCFAKDDSRFVLKYLQKIPDKSRYLQMTGSSLTRGLTHTNTETNVFTASYEVDKEELEKVSSYLEEHHAGYTVQEYEESYSPYNSYRIVPQETLSESELAKLSAELYHELGISPRMEFPTLDKPKTACAQNALERPGDTNLDCEVDILDVIAANKQILGVGTLDKTGLKNADMDGNGIADSSDSLELLKIILEIQ